MVNTESENASRTTIITQIKAVTVYTDQALIIRSTKLELTGEERELVIEDLPLSMQTDSVRTRGSGTVGVRILGLQTEQIFSSEAIEQRVVALTQEIEALDAAKRKIDDQLASIKLQQDFVQNLGGKYLERFSSLQPPERINLEEISDLLAFIGEKDQNYATQIAEYQRELLENRRQMGILRDRMRQIQGAEYRQRHSNYRIIISIEPERAGTFDLEISYLVNQASWTPLYDLRTNATGEELNLTYLAEVKQQTGEDWNGVSFTLSTAQPSLGKLPAKLKPFYIQSREQYHRNFHYARAAALRRADENDDFAKMVAADDEFGELEALLESADSTMGGAAPQIEAEQVTAETNQVGGIVTFSLDRNSTIPSDNQPHKVTLISSYYSCQTQHISVPRLDSFAYLEAKAVNPSDGATLLPGKANIFRDNTFIGTTQLDNIAPGQSFKINLGIDEGIKITRTLVKRDVELIGNYRRINYSYRIRITNLREYQTKLQLIEQLPVSLDEQIKVRLSRTQPEIELGDMGKLEWLLILQPKSKKQSQKDILYESSTEYPTDLTIIYSD